MEPLKILNRRLADYYGKDLDGNPYFRLVFANSQTEVRKGIFHDFAPGSRIIIRVADETREVPKYPQFRDFYILEKLCPAPPTNELPVAALRGYSYEPIWVFRDSKGEPVNPIWRAVEIIVKSAMRGPDKVVTSRTEAAAIEEQENKEAAAIYDELDNDRPYLATMLNNKEAVFLDSTKRKNG